jgi:hypothetical protein
MWRVRQTSRMLSMLSIPRHVALQPSGLAQLLQPVGLARRHLVPDPTDDVLTAENDGVLQGSDLVWGVEALARAKLAGYAF